MQLKNVVKKYVMGDTEQTALRDVSISFRESEFVAILGPSGSGKTTLLNIIGGLDQYTSGDLIINGKSTKEYNDADWDTYRNHSIGFVFQSYNLIPHQSVLSNVELALTLSGVSKAERRRRAVDALNAVGLSEHIHKRPNQMSGGQMQRVAIARALVNDPDILLADEPTGALDSETSVQIMDILKEVSKDKLVIMVTHNPDLAETYATRTVQLLDGRICSDTDPYEEEVTQVLTKAEQKKIKDGKKKTSMSFFTALSLSLNNLMTKKARTILTSFAGSIGIIGIALILSVSTGVQAYIDRVQEDTLSSYPIMLQKETVDLSSLVMSLTDMGEENMEVKHDLDAVYESKIMYDLVNTLNSAETDVNDLEKFKEYLESNEEFKEYLSAVKYTYGVSFDIYMRDEDGKVVKSDVMDLFTSMGADRTQQTSQSYSAITSSSGFGNYNIWEEMLDGEDGQLINDLVREQYDVLAGRWPESYDEIVLVVNGNNELSDLVLYALGLKTGDEMKKVMVDAMTGKELDADTVKSWSYDELMAKTFKLIPAYNFFTKNTDGAYVDLSETETGMEYLFNNGDCGINLKISGIVRASDDTVSSMMTGAIGYTTALTQHVLDLTGNAEIIKAQLADKETDVILNLPFKDTVKELTEAEKAEAVRASFKELTEAGKAEAYIRIASVPTEEYLAGVIAQMGSQYTREQMEQMLIGAYAQEMGVDDTDAVKAYIAGLDDEELNELFRQGMAAQAAEQYKQQVTAQLSAMPQSQLALMLDQLTLTDKQAVAYYEEYMPQMVSDSTYEKNLRRLGYADPNSPTSINLYASTFADKDEIARLIDEYNKSVDDEKQIKYTDYVALLMSSITTIINSISYVLIAFVAISLVVSSIMIGIITYISVLERTKEIGILRAIGASKGDVSRIFNAETLIVGLAAGVFGIGISLLMLIPINLILHKLTGIMILSAQLPTKGAITLVIISMVLTLIAGLIPSRIAAKKDPVVALRTE